MKKCVFPKIEIDVNEKFASKFLSKNYKHILIILFSVALVAMNAVRMLDACFWADECFAINAASMSFSDMMVYLADEGHTPFFYVFLWIFARIFGFNGFVYHLAGQIPYIVIIVFCVTYVRKVFGNISAIILIAMSSLLECAMIYNLEVRMYAWCELFIFMAFIFSHQIYKANKKSAYILMCVFGTLAVYGHYFALGTIGLMYLCLLIYKFVLERRECIKVIASGILVPVLFSPWLIYCQTTQGVVMKDYNMDYAHLKECLLFIFSGRYSKYLFLTFMLLTLITFLYEFGTLKTGNDSDTISLSLKKKFSLKNNTDEIVWMFSGLVAVFGTIAAALFISVFMFPILNLRYVYISYIIIWFLFGIFVQRCRLRRIITIVLILALISGAIPPYMETIKTERERDALLTQTLELTQGIDEDDMIYTDNVHFNWTVEQVYYPKTPRALFEGTSLPIMDESLDNWLFLDTQMSPELAAVLEERGVEPIITVENGFDGVGYVWIYRLVSH